MDEIRLALQCALTITDQPGELERAAEAARAHVAAELAPNTVRAYRGPWQRWEAYCGRRGVASSPVRAEELIVYLTGLSLAGSAPNTVRMALSAISAVDQRARASELERDPTPVRHDPLVRAWHRGWSREHPRAPKRKAPVVLPGQIEAVIRAAQERPRNVSPAAHAAQYARDRAMLLIGVTAALRVSELVALELVDVAPDLNGRGLVVTVRRSKTDPEGLSHRRAILPQSRTLRCPVEAWSQWRRVRGDRPGAAFVAVGRAGELARDGLDESAARKIIVRRAKAAGIDLTSHSMRRTLATLSFEKGRPAQKIAKHGNWKSLDVLGEYIEQRDLFDDNPSAGLLDD